MNELIRQAKGLKLPIQFKAPQGDPGKDHYGKAFKPSDKGATPQLMPPWFMPAEPGNKYYQDSCDKIGNDFAANLSATLAPNGRTVLIQDALGRELADTAPEGGFVNLALPAQSVTFVSVPSAHNSACR